MITVERGVLEAIQRHAREHPRREVCGVLLGAWGPPIAILDVMRGTNMLDAPDRYLLDAATLLAADDAARARGWAVVGFYHSHPNQTPIPSHSDRATAWQNFAYLIAGAHERDGPAICAWHIDHARTIRPLLVAPRSSH
jgi:proteasome lid subunit RPN8/RPN11